MGVQVRGQRFAHARQAVDLGPFSLHMLPLEKKRIIPPLQPACAPIASYLFRTMLVEYLDTLPAEKHRNQRNRMRQARLQPVSCAHPPNSRIMFKTWWPRC